MLFTALVFLIGVASSVHAQEPVDLAVVGGGPSGLAAAIAFAKRSAEAGRPARVEVLEVRADHGEEGGAFSRDQELGLRRALVGALSELGVDIPRQHQVSGVVDSSTLSFATSFADQVGGTERNVGSVVRSILTQPFSHSMPIAQLQRLLRVQAEASGITLRFGSNVVGYEEGANAARLIVEENGVRRTLHAKRIVAADGARSRMRGLAGIEMRYESGRAQGPFVSAGVWLEGAPGGPRLFRNRPSPGQTAAIFRRSDQSIFANVSLPADLARQVEAVHEGGSRELPPALRRAVEEHAKRVIASELTSGTIVRPSDAQSKLRVRTLRTYPIRAGRAERFSEGRVLLLGNAAFTGSVFTGRDANLAIVTAAEGGRLLADLRIDPPRHGDTRLADFEARLGRVGDVQVRLSARVAESVFDGTRLEARQPVESQTRRVGDEGGTSTRDSASSASTRRWPSGPSSDSSPLGSARRGSGGTRGASGGAPRARQPRRLH